MPRREFVVSLLTHPPREIASVADTLLRILSPSLTFFPNDDKKRLPYLFSSLVKGDMTKATLKRDDVPPIWIPPMFSYPHQVWDIFEAHFSVEMREPHVVFEERGTRLAPASEQAKWEPDFPWILAFREAVLRPHLGAMTACDQGGLLHWVEGIEPLKDQFINVLYVSAQPFVQIPTPEEVAQLVKKFWPEGKRGVR